MKLTLIRGLPGSGKSTMAKRIPGLHVEADMYFVRNGEYKYERESIGIAHAWCVRTVEDALSKGLDVVVSNTFVKQWEMDRYVELAKEYGATLCTVVAQGNYPSIHGVPSETIEKMRRNWED